ncbi:MAG: outer membrane protein transport protein [Deltaproteobacteria bacterium]|nr:outer membrane protein transport protein [Deltaproteobacteria bacterium]
MRRLSLVTLLNVTLFALLTPETPHAGGLYLSSYGSPDMGTASAGAQALAMDASTAFLNPAGMTRLEDHQFLGGLAPGFATNKFKADQQTPSGGGDGGDQGGFIPVMSASYVHKLSDDVGLGLSLISLAGAALSPNDDWAGRFQMTEVSLLTLTIAPTVGFRVTDWLSIGAGAFISYARFEQDLRVALPLREPTAQLQEMTDWDATGIVSALIEPCEGLRFGVMFQGETEFKLDGNTNIPPLASSSLDLELPLARAVRNSIYWDATDDLALMMTGGWEDWSAAKSIPLSASGAATTVNLPLNFRDTWYIGAGGHYKVSDKLTLQTGFRYDSSALKDKDRTVFLPVDRTLTVGVGALYDYSDTMKIGFALTWANLGTAPVNNASVKGKYTRNELFLFGVTLNWKKLPWSGRGTVRF